MVNLPCRKIVVVGISGTGKSTISKMISELTGLPVYHMDGVIWEENWQESEIGNIERKLSMISQTDRWIVEGWIDSYSKTLLECSDIIIYLDYPGWLAMWGGLQRWWAYHGKQRPEMPKGCSENLDLQYLLTMLFRRERQHIEEILKDLDIKKIVRFMSRRETQRKLRFLLGVNSGGN